MGYIKSADNGNTWSSFTAIDVAPLIRYGPYGHIVKAENIYYQPFYGDNNGTPRYVKLFKSEDNGNSWTVGPTIYSGSSFYTETCVEYIGDNKLIAMMRIESGGKVRQSVSSDGGNTWSTPVATNLGSVGGATNVQILFSIYDSGKILLVFCDRAVTSMKISEGNATSVFNSPTAWGTEEVLMRVWSGFYLYYPSIVRERPRKLLYCLECGREHYGCRYLWRCLFTHSPADRTATHIAK